MWKTCFALCLMLACPAMANGTMTADEFDAFTRGKTFHYGRSGEAYGAEEYLPGNRVIWSFLDGQCQEGIWYEDDGRICFEYETIRERQCWTFREGPDGGLIARFESDPQDLELYEVERSAEPLECPGPQVGV